MKAIKLTVFAVSLFISTTIIAQSDSPHSKRQERYLQKFSLQLGAGGVRFLGKKESEVEHSKEGWVGNILPAWNITDNHSIGVNMVGSFHNEKNSSDYVSLLANYQFIYYGDLSTIDKNERLIGLYAGLGVGFSTVGSQSDSLSATTSKTSFAMMPYLGIRSYVLYATGNFHWAVGNKQATYVGFSAGIYFGGGLLKNSKH